MTSITTEKAPLNVKQLQQMAKELKVPGWHKMKREQLVAGIAAIKGWGDEKPEVIEFLLNGGCITELPGFTAIAPKKSVNNRETSAGGKVEPEAPKKAPRKVSKDKSEKPATKKRMVEKARKSGDNVVSIQDICQELGVEGRVARRKLRGSDIAKPGDSWIWETGHADIAKVKALLK